MNALPPADKPLREPPDAKRLRAALGGFATGVTIVSCRGGGGEPVGLTVNSFNALSLSPPLVLWSLRLASPSLAAFSAATHFAVNVLAESQVSLSRRFAAALPGKFEQGEWVEGEAGVPLLAGSAASFECERISQQDAGDHRLFIGQVLACHAQALAPLVFHRGHYHLLGEIL
jgi:flavin reductase (DIM6/NTAB) family NADH-FMN oxidoreductase RutF